MKALRLSISIPHYLAARATSGLTSTFTLGPLSGLHLVDVPEPTPPTPEWAALEVLGCGICGTDLATVWYRAAPSLEPFSSFPAVLGHEVLARVASPVAGFEVGQRVVVDPMFGCTVRGRAPRCVSCDEGSPTTCAHTGDEGPLVLPDGRPLARGGVLGFHRDLPGGFSTGMVAHRSQLHAVPDGVPDALAVLTEPLAVAVHAALRTPLAATDEVLVVGSGPIALATIWALRATGFSATVVAQVRRAPERELATSLGATEVVAPGPEADGRLARTGSRPYEPIVGAAVPAGGGFPVVFDCVGSRETLTQALTWTRPRGRVVLLGCAAELARLDLSPLWARELTVQGYLGYGREADGRHTYAAVLEALEHAPGAVGRLVTHRVPLARYRDGFAAAADRRRSGALKVVVEAG